MGSVGIWWGIALWTRRESLHRAQLAEHINVYAPQSTEFSARLDATGMPPDQVNAVLERILSGQANMLATNDVFWLFGCLLIILLPLIWLARPPFGRPSAAVVE